MFTNFAIEKTGPPPCTEGQCPGSHRIPGGRATAHHGHRKFPHSMSIWNGKINEMIMGNPLDMGILNHFHGKNIYKSGFGNMVVRIGSTHPFPFRFPNENTISNGEFLRISVPICAMVNPLLGGWSWWWDDHIAHIFCFDYTSVMGSSCCFWWFSELSIVNKSLTKRLW